MTTAQTVSTTTTQATPAKFLGSEARALELLSSGYDANVVAKSLGLSDGRISQLLHEPEFASALVERRFENLKKHNETDDKYDALEKQLLSQLERALPMCMRPMEIARMLQIINSAKRRGVSSPDHLQASQRKTVVLNIPIAVIQKFQTNAASQVVSVSDSEGNEESLVTIQSSNVQRLLNERAKEITELIPAPTRESDGKVWVKPQGREKVDLLEECGFTHEVEVGSTLLAQTGQ